LRAVTVTAVLKKALKLEADCTGHLALHSAWLAKSTLASSDVHVATVPAVSIGEKCGACARQMYPPLSKVARDQGIVLADPTALGSLSPASVMAEQISCFLAPVDTSTGVGNG